MPHRLWQLITDTAHVQMSQWQRSVHKHTILYSAGWNGTVNLHEGQQARPIKHSKPQPLRGATAGLKVWRTDDKG